MTTKITEQTKQFWNELYTKRDQIWSGKPNLQLTRAARTIKPGTVLDLGCGEGGDAVWLAQQGWHVIATDVSPVALERSRAFAAAHSQESNIEFQQHDFAVSFPAGTYDLVSAQFLQSPLEFQRTEVLQKAAAAVAVDGYLLIVEHGSAPSWSPHASMHFPSAQETFDSLELDNAKWRIELLDAPERPITGPSGEQATIKDNVIFARRLAQ